MSKNADFIPEEQEAKKPSGKPGILGSVSLWRGVALAAGVALIILIAVTMTLFPGTKEVFEGEEPAYEPAVSGISISKLGAAAFGRIVAQEGRAEAAQGDGALSAPQAAGIGGGGMQMEAEKAVSSIAPMPPIYKPKVYKYIYKGEEIPLKEGQAEVLKRIKETDAGLPTGTLNQLSMGLLDVSELKSAKVRHMSLSEDIQDGYDMYLNPMEGTASININWEKWADRQEPCYEEGCRLKLEDIPGDAEIVEMAGEFLSKYGINTEIYGEPKVDKSWLTAYRAEEGSMRAYIPEQMSVTYPLEVEGETVYEQGGRQHGVRVSVDIRNRRAVSAYNLTTHNYQSSAYEVETDWQKILEFAERGGRMYYYEPEGAEIVEIELGAPEKGYLKHWNYNQETRISEELIVPALVFPIVGIPADLEYFSQESVVVPIVSDLLKEPEDYPVRIMPAVEPMIEPAPAIEAEITVEDE